MISIRLPQTWLILRFKIRLSHLLKPFCTKAAHPSQTEITSIQKSSVPTSKRSISNKHFPYHLSTLFLRLLLRHNRLHFTQRLNISLLQPHSVLFFLQFHRPTPLDFLRNRREKSLLLWLHQRHNFSLLHYTSQSLAALTSTRCSTRSMNVRLRIERKIVVHHYIDVRNIHTACDRIGADEQPDRSFLEHPHRFLALLRSDLRRILLHEALRLLVLREHDRNEQKQSISQRFVAPTDAPYRCCYKTRALFGPAASNTPQDARM